MIPYEDDGMSPLPTTPTATTTQAPQDALTSPAPASPLTMTPVDPTTAAPASYGGTGAYGDLSYADAVQQAYRDQQARQAATGVAEAPIDYSMAGLSEAGLWGMSAADTAANAARVQTVLNDPASTQAAKDLVSLPGYGTPTFDRSLNNGSDPGLLAQVQGLLGLSAVEGGYAAPSGSTTDSGGSSTQASGGSGSGTTSIANGGTAIDRLLDVAAAMYAGAGVQGRGSGFGGLVSGPLGQSPTGEVATPVKSSRTGLVIVSVLVLAAIAWYYKTHKKHEVHHA